MGHGASTNVKKLTISQSAHGSPRKSNGEAGAADEERAPSPAKLGWTRSSSDGCIVENLNTSKTKVELLEQQLEEFKELFRHADVKAEEAHARAVTLEQQMAEVEGTNFELLDRVSELEQQLEESKDQTSPDAEREFSQMLLEKDQIVEKQEQQIKSLEEDLAKMRIKLKKRLRAAQTKLAEAKQEAGLKVYSLKDQLTSLQEENAKLTERLDRAHQVSSARSRQCGAVPATPIDRITEDTPTEDDGDWEDGRTKVILEISSQLSAQEQRISELEEAVREREQTIQTLRAQLKAHPRPPSGSQKNQSAAFRSRSAEKRSELPVGDSSKETASDEDGCHQSSVRRQRTSSSSRREGHRSSSSGRRETSQEQRPTDKPSNGSYSNREIRNVSSASSGRLRQQSANSLDSAISDRSDSSSAKASSAGSSRERRRLRNQRVRQSSADERTTAQSEIQLHDRDSGIGITSDAKLKDDDDLEQMMEDIVGNS
ncbi:periplakin-like [Patiria miniata]|uniref:Uncharacterized protein n=1 Tax=Patiria miniata TaxID=46514 RepID=A0A914B4X9_PATMI|nr:periplakin-like [Patiria miniata]